MRLGHTLTHGYLGDNDVPPHCELCNKASLSVKHLMVECEQLFDARRAYLELYKRNRELNIGELLGIKIRICVILTFLRYIGAYDLI